MRGVEKKNDNGGIKSSNNGWEQNLVPDVCFTYIHQNS